MDLKPTEEQQAFVEALHDFAANEVRPAARECEHAGRTSEPIHKQLFEMGVSTPVPEEFGGQGTFDTLTSVLIAEALAWGDPGVAYEVLGRGLAATLIDLAGSTDQRATWLPKFLTGTQGAVAIAERDAGGDLSELATSASGSTLTGIKYLVPLPGSEGPVLVAARDGASVGLWLVDRSALEAVEEDKLGLRSASTFKVMLNGTTGEPMGGDPDTVKLALLRAKLLNAGVALGLARAAHEYSVTYARERTAFGRPIGAFQGISFKVADRAMDLQTARLLVWKAAWSVDHKRDDAELLVMMACGHAAAAAVANADDGVQILGGHGYMQDHPEEMWYRDALTLAAVDSASLVGDVFAAQTYKAVTQ